MRSEIVKFSIKHALYLSIGVRSKTTSAQYVASRARDPTFEKLMDKYKNLVKVNAIQDLILANPQNQSVSLEFLSKLSQKLHLNRGATAFLRKYPHIFHIFYDPVKLQPSCRLTDTSLEISFLEAGAINASLEQAVDRLVRILHMSTTKTVPLRAIFRVWRDLGLPDDFEDSVIARNSDIFQLCDAHEPGTHLLKLVDAKPCSDFTAAVENWRVLESCKEDSNIDRNELRFSFKHGYPPGMRLTKNFKSKVKEWQRSPYMGPYETMRGCKTLKPGILALEKRAVSIVHEFLSLTVEKMVEVEKVSHFRSWFGIDLNIRDLFLDHPGIFYLSTKGKRHTVFLREAYERGQLIEPNPVYAARRKLFDLVALGRHGLLHSDNRTVMQPRSSEKLEELSEEKQNN